MPAIHLTQPPYKVATGPRPGVYLSREAYEEVLRESQEQASKCIFDHDPWLDEGGEG